MQPHLVSKADFARLKNVSGARVSQWIASGKLDGAALVGEGRAAKIDVAIADEQLRQRLDLTQRVGNGLSTRLEAPEPPQLPVADSPPAAAAAPSSPVNAIEEQFKRERLEGLQRENRRKAEEEAARAGRFVDSQAARAEMAKIAGRVVSIVDGALPEIAAALAAKFAAPQRDVLHLLRAEFRNVRQRAATAMRSSAIEVPAFVEAELGAEADEVAAA
jgi:hypothetical protein